MISNPPKPSAYFILSSHSIGKWYTLKSYQITRHMWYTGAAAILRTGNVTRGSVGESIIKEAKPGKWRQPAVAKGYQKMFTFYTSNAITSQLRLNSAVFFLVRPSQYSNFLIHPICLNRIWESENEWEMANGWRMQSRMVFRVCVCEVQ